MQTHQFQLKVLCNGDGHIALYLDDDEIVNDIEGGDAVSAIVLNLEFEVAAKEVDVTIRSGGTEPRVTVTAA